VHKKLELEADIISFDYSAQVLAAASGQHVVLYDAKNYETVASVEAHSKQITGLRYFLRRIANF
jgi:hypothetical protein